MIRGEIGRYLVAGGVNTAVTYALYLVLLRHIDYRWAYVVAFVAGVLLSFVLLRRVVFGRPGRRHALAYVAASHGLQLLLGLLVVQAWVGWLRGPQWLAPLVAVGVCVPIVFALQRWVFTHHAAP